MIVLILLLSELLTVRTNVRFDYCSVNCRGGSGRQHTLCGRRYPKGGSSTCDSWRLGMSAAVKRVLLDKHNEARQRLASGGLQAGGTTYPTAADMRVMTWHAEAAYIAQRWMDQCTISDGTHDSCRDTMDGPAGQNLYWGTMSDNDTAVAVNGLAAWFDKEAPLYLAAGHAVDRFTFAMDSAHFTQVAWASTTGVGCGLRKKAAGGGMARYSLACNYFPAGNFQGMPVYKSGPPCSACPEGTKCSSRYPALCGRPGDDDADITDFVFGGDGKNWSSRLTCPALLISSIVLTPNMFLSGL